MIFIPFLLQANNQGNKKIDSILLNFTHQSVLQSSHLSFVLMDPQGTIKASYQEQKLMMPASVLKIITTATALQLLGPQFTYTTKLGYTGKINRDQLFGDIWIEGGGDPSLGSILYHPTISKEALMKEWLLKLTTLKIKSIQGSLYYDDQYFDNHDPIPSWLYEDIANYYGAMPGGLNWQDNMFQFTVKDNLKHGDTAVIESFDEYSKTKKIIIQVTADSTVHRDESYLFPSKQADEWIWKGTIPALQSNKIIKGAMPKPGDKLIVEWHSFLKKNGITVKDSGTTVLGKDIKRNIIYQVKSPPLKDLIKTTNMQSINLFAEAFLKAIGKEKTGYGTTKNGMKILLEYWSSQGIDLSACHLEDGSGLSRMNVVNAQTLGAVLAFMNQNKNKELFRQSLPIAGISGTMKSICRNQAGEGKIIAKTGTMEGVLAYAGYIKSKSNQYYPFCLMLNHFTKPTKDIRKVIEHFFNECYAALP